MYHSFRRPQRSQSPSAININGVSAAFLVNNSLCGRRTREIFFETGT